MKRRQLTAHPRSAAARFGPIVAAALALACAAFVIVGGGTALWYDEANYLSVASGIKTFGLPVWFWDPDLPTLFLDSPPGLLYALSRLPDAVLNNPSVVRGLYAATSLLAPLIVLAFYLRIDPLRWLVMPIVLGVLFTTGFFYMELVQVRMDLPLAALSFVGLIVVATIDRPAATASVRWRGGLLIALLFVTTAAFLTKYQAVCLSAALLLWGLDALVHRRNPFGVLAVHGLGGVAALLTVASVARLFDGGVDQSFLDNFRYNLGRIFASSGQAAPDVYRLGGLAKSAVSLVAVPAGLYVLARAVAPAALRSDPLMRLSVNLAAVVLLFNLITYRMPGAGNYYMIQAAFPLAYLTARSIVVLAEVSGTATLVAVAVGTLNLFVTLPAGDRSLQRWGAGLPSLVDGIVRPDQSRIVARQIAQQLRPGEIVLLDSWRAQARQVPYWLQRSSGYGYLIEMSPQTADRLLQREGSNRVAFIVFSGSSEFATLKRPEWAQTWSLIEMNFELLDRASTPDWYVYRRKD